MPINPLKPYLEFVVGENGEISGKAHGVNLPLAKCSELSLRLLRQLSPDLDVVSIKPTGDEKRQNVQRRVQGRNG